MDLDIKSVVRFGPRDLRDHQLSDEVGNLTEWLRENTSGDFKILIGRDMTMYHMAGGAVIPEMEEDVPQIKTNATDTEVWFMFSNIDDATLFKLTWK